MCCQYHKALKFYLNCGETYIDKAIALVGEAQSDMLTHTLIDFLSGDTDGVPKDNNYVYRLYVVTSSKEHHRKNNNSNINQLSNTGTWHSASTHRQPKLL